MDTLQLSLSHSDIDGLKSILKQCDNYCEHSHINGSKSFEAKIKNLRFKANDKYLKMYGSIAKYVHSSNQYDVSPDDTIATINSLSHFFKLDFKDAIVNRVDKAHCIILDYPVGEYLSLFRESATSKRFSVSNETVDIRKHDRTLSMYDKNAELKFRNQQIDKNFEGKNLIRLELRLKKNIPRYFKVPSLTFQMLTEPWCINRLNELWANEILNANVCHKYIATVNCRSCKALVQSLASHGVEHLGGLESVMQNIYDDPSLTAGRRYRLTNKLKEIDLGYASNSSKILLDELYDKVRFIASIAA